MVVYVSIYLHGCIRGTHTHTHTHTYTYARTDTLVQRHMRMHTQPREARRGVMYDVSVKLLCVVRGSGTGTITDPAGGPTVARAQRESESESESDSSLVAERQHATLDKISTRLSLKRGANED